MPNLDNQIAKNEGRIYRRRVAFYIMVAVVAILVMGFGQEL